MNRQRPDCGPQFDFGHLRRVGPACCQRDLKIDDEGYDYVIGQLIEMMYHSNNVCEIFVEDSASKKNVSDYQKVYR